MILFKYRILEFEYWIIHPNPIQILDGEQQLDGGLCGRGLLRPGWAVAVSCQYKYKYIDVFVFVFVFVEEGCFPQCEFLSTDEFFGCVMFLEESSKMNKI